MFQLRKRHQCRVTINLSGSRKNDTFCTLAQQFCKHDITATKKYWPKLLGNLKKTNFLINQATNENCAFFKKIESGLIHLKVNSSKAFYFHDPSSFVSMKIRCVLYQYCFVWPPSVWLTQFDCFRIEMLTIKRFCCVHSTLLLLLCRQHCHW